MISHLHYNTSYKIFLLQYKYKVIEIKKDLSYLNKNFYRGNRIKHNVLFRIEEIVGGISSHKLDSDIQCLHFLYVWLLFLRIYTVWTSSSFWLPRSIVLFASWLHSEYQIIVFLAWNVKVTVLNASWAYWEDILQLLLNLVSMGKKKRIGIHKFSLDFLFNLDIGNILWISRN